MKNIKEVLEEFEILYLQRKIEAEINFRLARSYSLMGKMDAKMLSSAEEAVQLHSQRLLALRELTKEVEEDKIQL